MSKGNTSCLRVIFTFFIFHCSLFICFGQVASRSDGVTVIFYDSLNEAFAEAVGVSVDSPDEITLLVDVVLDEPLIVDDGVHIRLVADGDRTIRRSVNNIENPVIWIRGDSASLTLKPDIGCELVIDGGRLNNPSIEAHAPLIALNGPGAKLIMYDLVVLQNNINIGDISKSYFYQYGSGVFIRTGIDVDVSTRQAEFIMRGGIIRGNFNNAQHPIPSGGAVLIQNYGIFTMEGGVIMNNTAHQGGGVYLTGGGSFNKIGGIIYGANAPVALRNTATVGLGTPPCYAHSVAVASVVHLLGKFRDDTVGENDNLSYIGNTFGDGIFGRGEKWDTPGMAFLRMLLAIILPVLALVVCVVVLLRTRYIKKLEKEIQEAADTSANAVKKIDLENMGLSDQEKEMCELLLSNRNLKEIAPILGLSYTGTIKRSQKLYAKLGVENRTELLVRVKK